ncbi:Serine/threonine-protein kinase HSL1, partial [Lucilia cuprina]
MADHRLSQISTASSNNSKRGKSYIGPWQLGKTLGSGSSGRVRLAKHVETGKLAAVKIVAKSQFTSQNSKPHGKKNNNESYGIEREVIIMKLIEHPNVMALYDVWENKGELYLVLEYVE